MQFSTESVRLYTTYSAVRKVLSVDYSAVLWGVLDIHDMRGFLQIAFIYLDIFSRGLKIKSLWWNFYLANWNHDIKLNFQILFYFSVLTEMLSKKI